jgi:hypothetical protein
MGVTSALLPERAGEHELSEDELTVLVTYTRLLGLPAQRNAQDERVKQGEQLFSQIGCVRCHAAETKAGDTHPFAELRGQAIRPYSDLLLHGMGEDLDDGSGTTQASEWRTPPLWGLGLIETVSGEVALLHDGRARSPLEAVLWHGGEAAFARSALIGLDKASREALLAFLGFAVRRLALCLPLMAAACVDTIEGASLPEATQAPPTLITFASGNAWPQPRRSRSTRCADRWQQRARNGSAHRICARASAGQCPSNSHAVAVRLPDPSFVSSTGSIPELLRG